MLTRAPRLPVVLALCLTALIAAPPLLAVDLGPGIVAEDQEMRFGAETLAGAGGLAPSVSGGDLVTLAATGGGTAPGDWQILADNRLAPAADGSLDDGDSIELVANGSAVFTVTARTTPGLLTVGGADEGAEWRAAWDAAEAGERIAARDQPAIEAVPEIAIAVPRGREGGPAPYGMRFEVAGLEGPVGHILRHAEFRWDFEESYPFRRHPRDRRVATDARYARGPWAAHVFATPGRYTVRLTATFGPGRVATANRVVEITDPDRVFHGK
ncbi:MAG: PKD domain-containing protein, partial [Pseudomonadota bacterium]